MRKPVKTQCAVCGDDLTSQPKVVTTPNNWRGRITTTALRAPPRVRVTLSVQGGPWDEHTGDPGVNVNGAFYEATICAHCLTDAAQALPAFVAETKAEAETKRRAFVQIVSTLASGLLVKGT